MKNNITFVFIGNGLGNGTTVNRGKISGAFFLSFGSNYAEACDGSAVFKKGPPVVSGPAVVWHRNFMIYSIRVAPVLAGRYYNL